MMNKKHLSKERIKELKHLLENDMLSGDDISDILEYIDRLEYIIDFLMTMLREVI